MREEHHLDATEEDQLLHSGPASCVANSSDDGSDFLRQQHDDHAHHHHRSLVYKSNRYSPNPLRYSVFYILLIEALERFSYYGLVYTLAPFLTGVYDADWNAGMTGVQASAIVAASTAIAFTAPFLGAWLADGILGDYWVIFGGTLVMYIPGCLLIAMSTVPGLLGNTFNVTALLIGLLCFYPVGAGTIKSVVNIFGAKQFHPVLQKHQISSYYVSFYMAINLGALCGGMLVSTLAQSNVTLAYFTPVAMLCLGLMVFAAGTQRYIITKANGGSNSSKDKTALTNVFRDMLPIAGVSALIVPFNVAYSQMATTFKVQGIVMKSALGGYLDAATINNIDAISVLACGYLVGSHLYPALAKRDIRIPTSYKFALGSFCGVLAMSFALLTEYKIHKTYAKNGGEISILWQTFSYICIGGGEIFCISAAYEAAFTIARHDQKAFASATNLFFVGGLPNVFCIFLYRTFSNWFHTVDGGTSIQSIDDYAHSQVYKYFFLLLLIALFGTGLNLTPPVRKWVAFIENIRHDDEHVHEATSYQTWLKRQYTRRCDTAEVVVDEDGHTSSSTAEMT